MFESPIYVQVLMSTTLTFYEYWPSDADESGELKWSRDGIQDVVLGTIQFCRRQLNAE